MLASITLLADRKPAPFRWVYGQPRLARRLGLVAGGITHLVTGFPIIMYEGDGHSLLWNSGGTDTLNFLGGRLNFQNPRKANVSSGIPYFNTALFTPSEIGFEGTANKAFFHGPGIHNFDMSLL